MKIEKIEVFKIEYTHPIKCPFNMKDAIGKTIYMGTRFCAVCECYIGKINNSIICMGDKEV